EGQMPFDHRLAEISLFPRGALPTKIAVKVFDPDGLFPRQPHLFKNIHLNSLPGFMDEIREVYSKYEDDAYEGKTVAIGSHGNAILAQLMVLAGISPKKFNSVRELIYGRDPMPNTGVSIFAYHPGKKKWELLVFKDNSYLPGHLQKGTTGIRAKLFKTLYKLLVIRRYLELKRNKGKPHPIHRDYYPKGKYSWWWNIFTPTERDVIERHEAFLKRYPDREALRLAQIESSL
ncbi:hypothetical protein ACFLQ8_02090, partial [Candidatus Auribacterota bacterium]